MNSNIRPQDLASSPSRSRTNVVLVTDLPRYDLNASVRWGGKKPQKIYIGSTPALLARAIEQNLDSGLYILLLQISIMLPWLAIGIVLAFDFEDTCEGDLHIIFSIGAWLLIEFILFFIDVLLWNPQCFHIDPQSFYIAFSIMSCIRLAWYILGWLMYADFYCKSAA